MRRPVRVRHVSGWWIWLCNHPACLDISLCAYRTAAAAADDGRHHHELWHTQPEAPCWLESSSFAGQPPTRHEKTVPSASEALELVREVSRGKPITQRGTYGAEVVELQERVERREMPVGVWVSR